MVADSTLTLPCCHRVFTSCREVVEVELRGCVIVVAAVGKLNGSVLTSAALVLLQSDTGNKLASAWPCVAVSVALQINC